MLPAGVAAGHPATVDAGIQILEAGGTAADAAVGACLASCVAETVMTGLLGGGHAIYWDAARQEAWNLDCFVAVPSGVGGDVVELAVPFGEELVHYDVGAATCGVPGLPAGLGALRQRYGRVPWPDLVAPALRLARNGVPMPAAHAACLRMLAPVMTMNEGGAIYSPDGRLLEEGELLRQPALEAALRVVADEGPSTAYRGTLAKALVELLEERGGRVTRSDLETYEPRWSVPSDVPYVGTRFLTRAGLSDVPETLARLPRLAALDEPERVLALAEALRGRNGAGDTTNLVTADRAGDVCVLTTSLGLGSGDFLPGYDLHLNSMLGEADLVRGELAPGTRMESMMAPSLAVEDGDPVLGLGAAGGTRLRTALLGVAAGVLDERLSPAAAVERPRFHPFGTTLHAEPGVDEDALLELERRGWVVRRWPERHHYFGGVSAIGRDGGAGDPRRSGGARLL